MGDTIAACGGDDGLPSEGCTVPLELIRDVPCTDAEGLVRVADDWAGLGHDFPARLIRSSNND